MTVTSFETEFRVGVNFELLLMHYFIILLMIWLVALQEASKQWFYTEQVHDWLYLIRELNFFEGNRCNIWLIKGSSHDVVIDTGKCKGKRKGKLDLFSSIQFANTSHALRYGTRY